MRRMVVAVIVLAAGPVGAPAAPGGAQSPTPSSASLVLGFGGAPALGGPDAAAARSVVALA